MTDRPVIGLFLALLVESSQWVKLRWDFDEDACARAWQMTTIITALAAVLIYMEGNLYYALPNLLTWLPPLLLPMQFVQSYGLRESIPRNTFSFLAKHRRKRNLRFGLSEPVVHVNFGNVYFVIALVASTLGSRSNGQAAWAFLPGIIVLTGWMLLAASRSRPLSLVIALAVAGCISVAGQQGLQRLEEMYGKSSGGSARFNPNTSITQIGIKGTVQQSTDIVWRLRPQDRTAPPLLLRTGGYNTFSNGNWETRPVSIKQFKDLDSRLYEGTPYFLLLPDGTETQQLRAVRKTLPRYKIRGAAFAETPLALPGDGASLRDLEVDSIERNGFGTVRVFPKQSVIEGTVLWKGETNTEDPPVESVIRKEIQDLELPKQELAALETVIEELKLADLPTLNDKLNTLRTWFHQNFTYTRTLTIVASKTETSVGNFLQSTRAGHCEYFATATALLLRKAGIPTRYATGYAVTEYDAKHQEFVIRGTHGHAWCRVWDELNQTWIDFDTTPPSWIPAVAQLNPSTQKFSDAMKRLREDFFLWRNQPRNRLGATLIMWAIGLGVAGFVASRLWKSKQRLESNVWVTGYEGAVIRTPLNALESAARKRLGPRPPGQPLAAWLTGLHTSLPDRHLLDEAIELHQQLRFDPAPQEPTRLHRLTELARNLESALKRK